MFIDTIYINRLALFTEETGLEAPTRTEYSQTLNANHYSGELGE